ncbi:MAG TPA: hypothetical protein VE957_03235 [Terriglobales bacterium]|nr:hypothetical protein [Terriglobales bacterium]
MKIEFVSIQASIIREFRTMVKTLHSAGLEAILDVVDNHTAEGNHLGPTLSLRRRFFQGRPIKGANVKDVLWVNPGGNEISEDEWRDPSVRCLGMFLSGQGLDETDERVGNSATKTSSCF